MTIVYIPGEDNSVADALHRVLVPMCSVLWHRGRKYEMSKSSKRALYHITNQYMCSSSLNGSTVTALSLVVQAAGSNPAAILFFCRRPGKRPTVL